MDGGKKACKGEKLDHADYQQRKADNRSERQGV